MQCEAEGVPLRIGGWTLTWHARQDIAKRGFRLEDVLATCDSPELSYTAFDYGPDRWIHQRGHVAVALTRTTRRVITMLLRRAETWHDEDARSANSAA